MNAYLLQPKKHITDTGQEACRLQSFLPGTVEDLVEVCGAYCWKTDENVEAYKKRLDSSYTIVEAQERTTQDLA